MFVGSRRRASPARTSGAGDTTGAVFLARHPTDLQLQAVLSRGRGAEPTYTAAGTTRTAGKPPGFRLDRYTEALGPRSGWDRAVEGLRSWAAHRGAGAQIFPEEAQLREGETLLVLLRAGPLHVIAPCRVVYLIDEADRFGFAYATLPGHPEQGEEAFVIEADANGLAFHVTAFSRPAETLAKIGAPVGRMVQRRVTNGYLSALRRYVAGGT